jgi:hypothetical protein
VNRHERRALKARGLDTGLAKVVAIHEAGHAVARYLTADAMGFSVDKSIMYIEVAFDPSPHVSLDGKALMSSQAVTFGPMYSQPMTDYLRENPRAEGLGPCHPDTIKADVAACKAAGIDVVIWACAKAFICMAASAAEARFTGRPVGEVADSYECENDLHDAMRECFLAGFTDEETANVCDNALDHAVTVFADQRYWRAVLSLADSLPARGKLNGRRAAAIITRALGKS